MRKFTGLAFLLLSYSLQGGGLETTGIISIDHSWSKDGLQKSKFTALIESSQNLTPNTSFTAIVRAQFVGPDALEPGQNNQPSVAPLSRRFNVSNSLELELRELYWDLDLDKTHLRLGKQQVVWGQADGLKLLDLINPQDFREFILEDFDDSRIPTWMVNFEWYLEAGDLQLLWIPDSSMHSLPGPGSTYEITAPFSSISPDVPQRFDPVDRPNRLFKDSDIGLRFSLFKVGWDITLNYFYHYDDFPVVRITVDSSGLLFTPQYERTHTFGASATNAFGDFVLRSEFVVNSDKYMRVVDSASVQGGTKSHEVAYVLGVDWSGLTDTFISMQVFQSRTRDNTDTNITFLLRRTFMNESLSTQILWLYHLNEDDNLLRLNATYELTSTLQISLYAERFSGKADELFGQFNKLDQIGIKLQLGI